MTGFIISEWTIKGKRSTFTIHTPSKLVAASIEIIGCIINNIDPISARKYSNMIIRSINKYVSMINDDDVIYNSFDHYLRILSLYHQFYTAFGVAEGTSVFDVEEAAIAINLKFLSCKQFERKFQSIKTLITRMKRVQGESERTLRRRFLLSSKILDTIYITGYNQEIAQRADELLVFLSPELASDVVIGLLKDALSSNLIKAGIICKSFENICNELKAHVLLSFIA